MATGATRVSITPDVAGKYKTPGGPLQGVRVLDFSAMVSGPMATSLLADQGADVIKVEQPGSGDLIRYIGCSRAGMSAIFNTINRNKRSIALDLSTERGLELALELVKTADVVVENFRPGVAERMGLGYKALLAVKPELVYASIRGFGSSGPRADQRVYDLVIQALSGMAASQGRDGRPEFVHNIVCDKTSAIYAAQAISAALFARERGAGGQQLELCMLDASVAFLWPDVMQDRSWLGDGVSAPAPLADLLDAQPTADGWVAVLAISDEEFAGLARALGKPQLVDDPRFSELQSRMEHGAEMSAAIKEVSSTLASADFLARLEAEGVPCAPVNTSEQLIDDPQILANGLLQEIEHPHCGPMRVPGPVARFEGTPAELHSPSPLLGEHSDQLLAELGLNEKEIAVLREQGNVA